METNSIENIYIISTLQITVIFVAIIIIIIIIIIKKCDFLYFP
jgi:hypothetical protein